MLWGPTFPFEFSSTENRYYLLFGGTKGRGGQVTKTAKAIKQCYTGPPVAGNTY